MKRCSACRCDKPESEFHRDRAKRDGLAASCKICSLARARKWYRENPEAVKKTKRKWSRENPEKRQRSQHKHRYGVSSERYNQMLLEQGGVCAICGQPDPRQNLSVDHNHVTGEVRGLLCHRCNRCLGAFQDREDLLAEAINYLRRSSHA